MRRSICTVEPKQVFAGETRTWKFQYTPATALPEKTLLLFDIVSNGRPIDWQAPSSDLSEKENVIWAEMDGVKKKLEAEEIYGPHDVIPKYRFKLPSKLAGGKPFTICVGDPKEKKWELNGKGTQAQTASQRRRPFFLYVDPTGKGKFEEPETFSIDIRGNLLQDVKVIAPSFVEKNKRFDVIIRFEDEFGNLTSNTPHEDTLITLTYEHIRENLNWKLIIPETGYIALPNLYFNEEGVYTITLENMATGETYQSSPIRCFNSLKAHLYWGSLHSESERVDSTENIESCLRHFRDEMAYSFYAISPFESQEETSNEIWKLMANNVQDFNEDDRFTTFFGEQMVGDKGSEGVRQLLFLKEQKQPLRRKDSKYSTNKKLYKAFNPKELISIPCFTMAEGYQTNFKDFDPEFERVVEIYSSWGSSECEKKEGNTCPIEPLGKKGVKSVAEGSIVAALKKGCRFGFVAGGLDDRGVYTDLYDSDQAQYPPGATAILAKAVTRDALFDALYHRRCYATTGERIILGLQIAGFEMGSEMDTSEMQGLHVNRHITGYVAGTTKLDRIEIIRNGEVIKTFNPEGYSEDFTFDDMTPLDAHAIKVNDKPPFVFYYIRVFQSDGHIAWSSPIWIDLLPPVKREKKPTKSAAKSAAKKAPPPVLPDDSDG